MTLTSLPVCCFPPRGAPFPTPLSQLWSLEPVRDARIEASSLNGSPPRLLCALDSHMGSVNVVRWSHSGQLLASGADDKCCLVYARRAGPGGAGFGGGSPAAENWRAVRTLRGHTMDVTDLAWSPHDDLLATCSVDNTVCVWDMEGTLVASLRGHSSLVKGVCWDPVGTYLASQSDDKSVIVWRTEDWSPAKRVTGRFEKAISNSFFRRLHWAPDGETLVCPHAYQQPSHTATVLDRSDFESKFDLVGHKQAVVCVRFSPAIYERGEGAAKSKLTVIAVGSKDNKMTVWTTGQTKPLAIVRDCFEQSVVDISWGAKGDCLMAASLDGTVTFLEFADQELGRPLSAAAHESYLTDKYGARKGKKGNAIAESPTLLALAAEGYAPAPTKPAASAAPAQPSPAAKPAPVRAGGKGGTRRIMLQPIGATAAAAANDSAAGTPKSQSNGGVAKRPAPSPLGAQQGEEEEEAAPKPRAPSHAAMAASLRAQQQEYLRADGKRRIVPVATDGGSQPGMPFDAPALDGVGGAGAQAPPFRGGAVPSPAMPSPTASHGMHRQDTPQAKRARYATHVAGAQVLLAPPAADGAAPLVPFTLPESLTAELKAAKGEGGALTLHAVNRAAGGASASGLASGGASSCSVRATVGAEVAWKDVLSSPAIAMAGNERVAVVGCQDGSLHVYASDGGRKLACPLMLGAPVSMLRFARKGGAWLVLALTAAGRLRVLDLLSMKAVADTDVRGLLGEEGASVVDASLSRGGVPTVALSSRRVYALHAGLGVWQRVVDAGAFAHSSFSSSLPPPTGDGASGQEVAALETLVRGGARAPQLRRALLGTSAARQQEETARHLEGLLKAAETMESPEEYVSWLRAYALHLAQAGEADRLRELCASMLGPPAAPNDGGEADEHGGWSPWILGRHARHLVRTVILPAAAKAPEMQRVVFDIKDQADALADRHGAPPEREAGNTAGDRMVT